MTLIDVKVGNVPANGVSATPRKAMPICSFMRWSLVSALTLIVFGSFGAGCDTTTAVFPSIRSVAIVSGNELWLALDSNAGTLVRLIDDRVENTTITSHEPIRLVAAYGDFGWALDGTGQLWISSDRGRKWVPGSSLKRPINGAYDQMAFVSENDGWIRSSGVLFSTTDGGVSWKNVVFFEGEDENTDSVDSLASQSFWLDRDRIWLTTPSGKVIVSADGGYSWERYLLVSGIQTEALWVVGDKEAWIATSGNFVFHTIDGGKTWTKKKVTANDKEVRVFSIYFQDSKIGWALGDHSFNSFDTNSTSTKVVLKTIDGGTTWREVFSTNDGSLFEQMRMIDSNVGWLVSEDSVYRTFDGGQNWAKLFTVSKGQTLAR